MAEKRVFFKLKRFNPLTDEKPYFSEFIIPVKKGMTVLDGLFYIKENRDGSLSFRVSCRMGVCGSCGMMIEKTPRLACQTQILELGRNRVTIEPMPNYPVLKDLVSDLEDMFEFHRMIKPFIIRDDIDEMDNPTREFLQTPEELRRYLQFSYCIKCGLCLSTCPTVSTDRFFPGPQALTQTYRYSADTRDDGFRVRKEIVDKSHGLWRCHYAGACSSVCPKGVDPALGIQLLKRESVFPWSRLKRKKLAKVAEEARPNPREGIPKPPEPTV